MRRFTTAALAAAFTFGGAMPAFAAPVHLTGARHVKDAGWAATATQGLSPKGVDLGEIAATAPLKIVVGLALRDQQGAQAVLKRIYTPGDAMYHQFLTPAQFAAAFGPTNAQAQGVANYLAASGFTGIRIDPNNLLVRAVGPAAAAERAFNTSIHAFNQNGTPIYANVSPALVPASLGGTVLSVLGLQNVPMQTFYHRYAPQQLARIRAQLSARAQRMMASRRNLRSVGGPTSGPVGATNPTAGPNGTTDTGCTAVGSSVCLLPTLFAADFRKVYDAPAGSPSSVTEAIFTEGDVSGVISDLRLWENLNGLAQIPVAVVNSDLPSPDRSAQVEFDMDTQTSTGLAGPAVNGLILYNSGSLIDSDITMAFNRFVTDNAAVAGSASFGECEYQAELDGAMALDDIIAMEGAVQGQSFFASSGDSGSSCGFNIVTNGVPGAGPQMVEYPTTSPYFVSAGGSTLYINSDGSYHHETSWDAGGGGMSYFENPAWWTSGVNPAECVPVYCSAIGPGLPIALTGGTGRMVPDVAMDADFALSPAAFYSNGALTSNGGTSLASPLALGSWIAIQGAYGGRLGQATLALYPMYLRAGGGITSVNSQFPPVGQLFNQIGGIRDILIGNNGAWTAKPGYDLTTGMGSIDIQKTISALR